MGGIGLEPVAQLVETFLGTGFGDRFKASRGGSRRFEERARRTEELAVLQGKRASKRSCWPCSRGPESSMVRRGSTVRVRQRAYLELGSRCKRRLFCCRDG